MRQNPNVHDFRVIVNPDVLTRLKTEDEDLLVDIERKYAGRLTFRTDPTYHHEKFLILDSSNNQELKA
jgi:ribonuclease G